MSPTKDCQIGLKRWNRTIGAPARHQAHAPLDTLSPFDRGVGPACRSIRRATSFRTQEYDRRLHDWIPSDADRAYVKTLMQRVVEPGKMAGWIAPPDRGINNLAVDYEYVRLSDGRPAFDLRFAPALVDVERRRGRIDAAALPAAARNLRALRRRMARALGARGAGAHFRRRTASCERLRRWDSWRRLGYREALDGARRIGAALLERGLGPERPLAILSENGIEFALLSLGAMHVGIPVAPVSPAYSLMSKDHAKLKYIFGLLKPGLVFASDPAKYALALAALRAESTPLAELMSRPAGARLTQLARVGPDTVAKILFTSGSTGTPKGVINTQRMLCANQQSWAQLWPFIERKPPVICEWLPWSHTFGGNATFNMALRNGGSFYVDAGKPVPGLIETTVRNLKEIATTMHFNVPRGYDLLLPFLESDASGCGATSFSKLDFVFYAAAALPQNLWERIEKLAIAEQGGNLAMLSAWGFDRDGADGHLRALPHRARRRDRPAGAGPATSSLCPRAETRGAGARSQRHSRLFP